MKRLILLAALVAAPAPSRLTPAQLERVATRPAPHARLPGAIRFTDARIGDTTLTQVAAGRPLLLIFADYDCPHVCGTGMALTAAALADTGLSPGRDYRLAVVGLDPRDDAATAERMRASIAPAALARDVALLRGDVAAIRAATGALGYRFIYDRESGQFAHGASVHLFGADGRLRAVLPQLGLRAEALRAALIGPPSATPAIGWGDRVARLCYGLAAAHGRYHGAIVIALQSLTLILAAGVAFLVLRRRRAA